MKQWLCLLCVVMVGVLAVSPARARQQPQQPTTQEKGPAVGRKLPAFSAQDQFGRKQTLASLTGTKGFVLLLFRSADW